MGIRATGTACGLLLCALLLTGGTATAAGRCGKAADDEARLDATWATIREGCGCSLAADTEHGKRRKWLACMRKHVRQAIRDGAIRPACREPLKRMARQSLCGETAERTTCCQLGEGGQWGCSLADDADACLSRDGSPRLGISETCVDACAGFCRPQDCNDGDPCTRDRCAADGGCTHMPLVHCGPPDPGGGSGGGGSGGSEEDYPPSCRGKGNFEADITEFDLLDALNRYRARKGRPKLAECASLSRSAQKHAEDMRDRDYFSHTDRRGRHAWDRACRDGFRGACGPATLIGEVLARGPEEPLVVLDQWQSSGAHHEVIRHRDLNVAGIGHACGGRYGHYWVMVFAGRGEASCE